MEKLWMVDRQISIEWRLSVTERLEQPFSTTTNVLYALECQDSRHATG